jgi:DNA-directed RNA polymerase subunit RPC12/RpoP
MSPEKAVRLSGQIKILGSAERIKRSFGRSVLVLIAGVFCVFIPGLHFILVPGCVIGSFVLFWKTYQQIYQLQLDEKLECPQCHQSVQVPSFLKGDLRFKCPHCAASCFVKKV